MKRPTKKQLIALALSVTYFAHHVVLASATESNLWAERRRANPTTQLAALPTSSHPFSSSQLLNQMPIPQPSASTISNWNPYGKKFSAALPQALKRVVESIPLSHTTIQDVFVAPGSKNPPVVLVQDIHLNSEAQLNSAHLLQELINKSNIGVVGVEGSFTAFDFAPYRKYLNKELTKAIVGDMVQKNVLAAPSYVGITSPTEPPLFMGVDDREHYNANLEALYISRDQKGPIQKMVMEAQDELGKNKSRVLTNDLKIFDSLRTAYHRGSVGLGAYLKKLSEQGIESDFVIDQFLEAYDMETHLDFAQIENERRHVIEKLTKTLTQDEISDLLANSVAYRTGRLSFGAYYTGLKNLCARKNIRLSETPHFNNYIRYVLLSDGIQADELFSSIDKWEEKILSSLIKTDEEKNLLLESEHLALTEKLIHFELTAKEWGRYKKTSPNPSIPQHGGEVLPMFPNGEVRRGIDLSSFENFYREADIRSEKMVANLNRNPNDKAQNPNFINGLNFELRNLNLPKPRVLVLGGFHSPHVAQLLREKKISYITVSPKITKVEGHGSEYLSVFQRDKTPLDRLFAGEKLFVYPTHVAVTNPTTSELTRGTLEAEQTGRRVSSSLFKFVPGNKSGTGNKSIRIHNTAITKKTQIPKIRLLISSLVETLLLQKLSFEILWRLQASQGLSASTQTLFALMGSSVVFSMAHVVSRWIIKAKKQGWKNLFSLNRLDSFKNFPQLTLFGFLTTFPLIGPVSFAISSLILISVAMFHYFYDILKLKGLFPKWMPLAMVIPPTPNGENLSHRFSITNIPSISEDESIHALESRIVTALRKTLFSEPAESIIDLINKMTANQYRTQDFRDQATVRFHEKGTKKIVFKLEFTLNSGGTLEIVLAVKQEKIKKGIAQREIQDLIKSSEKLTVVPKFGKYFPYEDDEGELNFYLEEFIHGDNAYDLRKSNSLTQSLRKSIISALLNITDVIGSAPRDFHAKNFIINRKTNSAVMVDIGSRRLMVKGKNALPLHKVILLIYLAAHFGLRSTEVGNKFLFDAFKENPSFGTSFLSEVQDAIHERGIEGTALQLYQYDGGPLSVLYHRYPKGQFLKTIQLFIKEFTEDLDRYLNGSNQPKTSGPGTIGLLWAPVLKLLSHFLSHPTAFRITTALAAIGEGLAAYAVRYSSDGSDVAALLTFGAILVLHLAFGIFRYDNETGEWKLIYVLSPRAPPGSAISLAWAVAAASTSLLAYLPINNSLLLLSMAVLPHLVLNLKFSLPQSRRPFDINNPPTQSEIENKNWKYLGYGKDFEVYNDSKQQSDYVIKIPRFDDFNEDRQLTDDEFKEKIWSAIQFSRQHMGGIIAPFVILEKVRIKRHDWAGNFVDRTEPFVIAQQRLDILPKQNTLKEQSTEVQQKIKGLYLKMIRRGILWNDDYKYFQFGLDKRTDQLYLVDFGSPKLIAFSDPSNIKRPDLDISNEEIAANWGNDKPDILPLTEGQENSEHTQKIEVDIPQIPKGTIFINVRQVRWKSNAEHILVELGMYIREKKQTANNGIQNHRVGRLDANFDLRTKEGLISDVKVDQKGKSSYKGLGKKLTETAVNSLLELGAQRLLIEQVSAYDAGRSISVAMIKIAQGLGFVPMLDVASVLRESGNTPIYEAPSPPANQPYLRLPLTRSYPEIAFGTDKEFNRFISVVFTDAEGNISTDPKEYKNKSLEDVIAKIEKGEALIGNIDYVRNENFAKNPSSVEGISQETTQNSDLKSLYQLKIQKLSPGGILITAQVKGTRCVFNPNQPSLGAYDPDGYPLLLDLTGFVQAILDSDGKNISRLTPEEKKFLTDYVALPNKPSDTPGNLKAPDTNRAFEVNSIESLQPKDTTPEDTLTLIQGEYTIVPSGFKGLRYLQTFGLANCVALCIWDKKTRTGFLAHIDHMTSDSLSFQKMTRTIAANNMDTVNLKAFVVGGDKSTNEKLFSSLAELLESWRVSDIYSVTRTPDIQSLLLDLSTGEIHSVKNPAKFAKYIEHRTSNLVRILIGEEVAQTTIQYLEPMSDSHRIAFNSGPVEENRGGIIKILRRLLITFVKYLARKNILSQSAAEKFEQNYNTLWAPIIENTLVFAGQGILMSNGLDAMSAGLWSWGSFAAVHIVEWLVTRVSGRNAAYSSLIAAFSLLILSFFSIDPTSLQLLLYGSVSIFTHMGINKFAENQVMLKSAQWLARVVVALSKQNNAEAINALSIERALGVEGIAGNRFSNNGPVSMDQMAQWIQDPMFLSAFLSNIPKDFKMEGNEAILIASVLKGLGFKDDIIVALTKLQTKKYHVIVFHPDMPQDELAAGLTLAKLTNQTARVAMNESARQNFEKMMKLLSNKMSVPLPEVEIISDKSNSLLTTTTKGTTFDAVSFTSLSKWELSDIALLHSKGLVINSGSLTPPVTILLNDLVPLVKQTNLGQLDRILRQIMSAA